MKTGTGIFLGALVLSLTSMFEFEVIDERNADQYHIVRYNKLTGDMSECIVSYGDESWAGCSLESSK